MTKAQRAVFTEQLDTYSRLINKTLDSHSKIIKRETLKLYGSRSRVASDAYLTVLNRGGKRIRGALTMHGYFMAGGDDQQMIAKAACAIEMIHAYILVIDDIQDRSYLRRGGLAAHEQLQEYHETHQLGGEADHFGLSLAINGALIGAHYAQTILTNLNVDEAAKLTAIREVNQTMIITAHGQTNDIMAEVTDKIDEADVVNIMNWKTAGYTFKNPLQLGIILAGNSVTDAQTVSDFAQHAGQAFQISDDIIGTFGDFAESGKTHDDIKEGKKTLLVVFALNNSGPDDRNFLLQMLGNKSLTPAEFEKCKNILVESGALDYSKAKLAKEISKAKKAITQVGAKWPKANTNFLHGLVDYLGERKS